MTKPNNRFANWLEKSQLDREKIIDNYLKFLGSTRTKQKNTTDLAKLVARHISDVQGAPCDKSTLLRNARYKAKLLSYQAQSIDPKSTSRTWLANSDPKAKHDFTKISVEVGNLKRELERLNAYVSTLEEELEQYRIKNTKLQLPLETSLNKNDKHVLPDYEYKFVRTCQTMMALLDNAGELVVVDPRKYELRDGASIRKDKVIAGSEITQPFFEWLAQNTRLTN